MIWSPKIEPHIYGHLSFDKGAWAIQRRKDNFPQMMPEQLETHREKSEFEFLLTSQGIQNI